VIFLKKKKPNEKAGKTRPRALRVPRKSIDRRVREQEERLDEKTKEQRRKRRAAKDVYGAIGFDLMYQDGTCQVEEGLFSETVHSTTSATSPRATSPSRPCSRAGASSSTTSARAPRWS
jgi:hypothetical protein